MIRKSLIAALCAVLPAAALAAPAQASAVPMPGPITAVTAKAGPYAGQVTFSWSQNGSHTTSYAIETGLTTFKVGHPTLPDHGRNARTFVFSAKRRSVTLSAAQVSWAGASAGSANHLYYRFRAVNHTASGTSVRHWGYLQWVVVRPATPAARGTALRVASFNVHTATPATGVRPWSWRVLGVAKTILSRNPGVVSLQELGVGNASGAPVTSTLTLTQTMSLLNTLHANGGGRYRLVRTTRYVKPGAPEGLQGARILYDSSRYSLVNSCPETAPGTKYLAGSSYSASCTIRMPQLSRDGAWSYRRAAYAVLADRATGKRFFIVSAHLDVRHSTVRTTERTFEILRAKQIKTVMARINLLNTSRLPVVLAGDLNTYQNNQGGYDAHDAVVAGGYYDTAAAASQVKVHYATVNKFWCTIPYLGSGWGPRLDVITVKGIRGATRWENVMAVKNCSRPSDHNMVVADIRLP